jgi:acetolactate synthase I/II/III large subunit
MNTVKETMALDSSNQAHHNNLPEIIGAEVLVRALAEEGVEFVWGYPGGSVLYIYDEIHKQNKFA